MKPVDKLDEKIMNELSINSKIPLRELALKMGVSFVTVMNRIKKLETKKIIKRYSAIIDHELIGYEVHVLIDIKIAKGKLFELERRIARSKNVYAVYDTTGEFDAVVLGKFNSTRSMDKFLKQMQGYDFIERTNTKLVLNTIKEEQISL